MDLKQAYITLEENKTTINANNSTITNTKLKNKHTDLKTKELFWLIGTGLFALIVILYLFGFDGFGATSHTDINLYDTYFVIANVDLILPLAIFIFLCVYLIRMLIHRFKNRTANLIFMIFNVLGICALTRIISILYPYGKTMNVTETDPLLKNHIAGSVMPVLYATLILLVGLLIICGLKIMQHYKRSVYKN